jgi:hypothetical protein
MTKYKVLPDAPFSVYYFQDDVTSIKKRIEFSPDGKFFINGKQSKDFAELGKNMVEWVLRFSESKGYIVKIQSDCDCGAFIAKTTCATWCSTKTKKKP